MQHMCIADMPGVLTAAIQSLQDLPGRKALLFVGRYKGPVDNIISLANRAGVVIYVLDTTGVVYEAATPADALAPDSERLLAEKTGGRRILSTVGFDLTTSFNEVIEDLSGYYLLGYHPAADESALKTPVRHKIEVKVLRAGLTVRVRDGLLGSPDPVARPDSDSLSSPAAPPPGREDILTKALFSVFTQDGVRIHLDPLFAASSPNQKKKRSPLVRAVLDIDGRDLTFADVRWRQERRSCWMLLLAVFNEDGTQAGAANKAFTLQVSKEKAVDLAKASVQYKMDVALSKPGPYQVRAAVRDATSGEVGSAYAFLDVPDFNQSKISLSSLVLTLPQGARPVPVARPDWNEFAPGATVQYRLRGFRPEDARKTACAAECRNRSETVSRRRAGRRYPAISCEDRKRRRPVISGWQRANSGRSGGGELHHGSAGVRPAGAVEEEAGCRAVDRCDGRESPEVKAQISGLLALK